MVLMKTLGGLSVVLILAGGLYAQNRSGFVRTAPVVRSFPNVVFPGGTSALPGVQRTAPNVLFPGGGTAIGVPGLRYNPGNVFNRGFNRGRSGFNGGGHQGNGFGGGQGNGFNGGGYAYPVAVPVPVYMGGYDDASAYGNEVGPAPAAPPQAPPNVIIIYPQGAVPPSAYNGMAPGQPAMTAPPEESPQANAAPAADAGTTPTHYLIALKDHSIYSAVAYWVDGDTLHYFTSGSTHNEVSLALVDRDLTHRLNEESGLQLSLPPAQ